MNFSRICVQMHVFSLQLFVQVHTHLFTIYNIMLYNNKQN